VWEKHGRVPDEELAAKAFPDEGKELFRAEVPDASSAKVGFSAPPEIKVFGGETPSKPKKETKNKATKTLGSEPRPDETRGDSENVSSKEKNEKPQPVREAVFPNRPTLLIIDDYEPLRQMIAKAMCGASYNVCAAKDGVEGIVRIHENKIDLIITDVQMPKLDGFEMSKMLNVRDKTREIPVIFLTEVLDDQTKAIAKRLGAADTLIKPFTMDSLFESVRTILASHSPAGPTEKPALKPVEPALSATTQSPVLP